MKHDNPVPDPSASPEARRHFLRQGGLLAVSALLSGTTARSLAGPAAALTLVPPARARGAVRIDVREHGAHGDGQQDDTAAIQAAIDALPPAGGTVHVPTGSYPIDAVSSIRLRSRMHLELASDARLVAIANAEKRSFVLRGVDLGDVEISGGQIVGERAGHRGATGEWGHGIQLLGVVRATVRDMRVSGCWGDGVCIGAAGPGQTIPSDDVVLSRVVAIGNRRQGLSILQARNVRVFDSEFSETSGTNPQFGIDIEPNKPGWAYDVLIENCRIRNNHGGGIQIYKRVSGVTIRRCVIEDNQGPGIIAVTAIKGVIEDNVIARNGKVGVALRQQTAGFRVAGNRFSGNASRRLVPAMPRLDDRAAPASAIRAADDTRDITITGNQYDHE